MNKKQFKKLPIGTVLYSTHGYIDVKMDDNTILCVDECLGHEDHSGESTSIHSIFLCNHIIADKTISEKFYVTQEE